MQKIIIHLISHYLNIINAISASIGGKQTFFLFCYPFKAKLKKHHQEFLSTSEKFQIEVDNKDIQCYKWGNGSKTILFVHGWQSNSFRWKKFINSYSKSEYTMYAFDFHGHGNSSGKIANVIRVENTIKTLIDKVGKVDSIIAHSIGSFSTFYFIDQNSELQPSKLVSLATPNSVDDFINFYVQKLSLSEKTINNFKKYFTTFLKKDISYFKMENFLKNNKAQGLIIHDKEDRRANIQSSINMGKKWPSSQLILTEGYGHKLNDETIVNMVHDFIISEEKSNFDG